MRLNKTLLLIVLSLLIVPFSVQDAFSKAKSLKSVKVDTPPKLDGDGGDKVWKEAKKLELEAEDGPEIQIRSVYTDERVYFLITWDDFNRSVHLNMWKYNGSGWEVVKEARFEDEPAYDADTDRIAFQWPIRNAEFVEKFAEKGCKIICHKPEKEDKMATKDPNHVTDIWQWKAALTYSLSYADDGYMDNTTITKKDEPNDQFKRTNAAHKWDDLGSGDLSFVRNKASNAPKWMPKGGPSNKPFLLKGGEVSLDMSRVKKGDKIPGYLLARPKGSRGDIDAAAKIDEDEGLWTLELSRKLVTDDKKYDVQFDDLSKTYYFGLATWDNGDLFEHTRVKRQIGLSFK